MLVERSMLPLFIRRSVVGLQLLQHHQHHYHKQHSHNSRTLAATTGMTPRPQEVWEIEKKFLMDNTTESKLEKMGFVANGAFTFDDWYVDVDGGKPVDASNFPLLRQDCWLRWRQPSLPTAGGRWELKMGNTTRTTQQNTDNNGPHQRNASDATTIFQELRGAEALHRAIELLGSGIHHNHVMMKEDDGVTAGTFESRTTPDNILLASFLHATREYKELIQRHCLWPFANITTTRTSWILEPHNNTGTSFRIQVDLDTTNTGYAVGEVEVCVYTAAEIAAARQSVQVLLDRLQSNGSVGPASSKLEHFLVHNRPDVQNLCQECGVL